jgi:hypothetical protein
MCECLSCMQALDYCSPPVYRSLAIFKVAEVMIRMKKQDSKEISSSCMTYTWRKRNRSNSDESIAKRRMPKIILLARRWSNDFGSELSHGHLSRNDDALALQTPSRIRNDSCENE